MTTNGGRIEFEILWYHSGSEYSVYSSIGKDRVKRHDLSQAITAACNMLRANKCPSGAHGFIVKKVQD